MLHFEDKSIKLSLGQYPKVQKLKGNKLYTLGTNTIKVQYLLAFTSGYL